MSKKTIYKNAPDDIAEALSSAVRIEDFLPSPENLVAKEDKVKVTISLNKKSVDFFKKVAKKKHVPYQQMLRKVIDLYVDTFSEVKV